jgi:chitinase
MVFAGDDGDLIGYYHDFDSGCLNRKQYGKTATVSQRKRPRRLTSAMIDSKDNGNS